MDNNFFGVEFINKNQQKVEVKLAEVKVVVLYFSASWCPPCQQFTPLLADFYNEINLEKKQLEIIWVNFEEHLDRFNEYITHMPWPAIPFSDPRVQQLIEKYEVKGVPTVTVVKLNGDVAVKNGKQDVMVEGEGAFDKWLKLVQQ
ncbi:hypothetical protein pb186bvf_006954 [Paramecium bursaria]